jgi:hypothetical protein
MDGPRRSPIVAVGALIKGLQIAIGRFTGGEFGWFSACAVL